MCESTQRQRNYPTHQLGLLDGRGVANRGGSAQLELAHGLGQGDVVIPCGQARGTALAATATATATAAAGSARAIMATPASTLIRAATATTTTITATPAAT